MERDFAKQKLEEYLAELKGKRKNAAEAHKAFQARSSNPFTRELGSTEVYGLALKIKGAVELAQKLGIIDPDKDPQDFL